MVGMFFSKVKEIDLFWLGGLGWVLEGLGGEVRRWVNVDVTSLVR